MFLVSYLPNRPDDQGRYRIEIHHVPSDSAYSFHCDREYLEAIVEELTHWLVRPEPQPGEVMPLSPLRQAIATLRDATEVR